MGIADQFKDKSRELADRTKKRAAAEKKDEPTERPAQDERDGFADDFDA